MQFWMLFLGHPAEQVLHKHEIVQESHCGSFFCHSCSCTICGRFKTLFMALQQPTRRQHDVALAILKHQNLHGQSPTLKDLAQAVEIGVSSIYQHLTQLKKKGWVTWQPHGHRSLRFTEQGAAEAVTDLTHTCT